MLWTKHLWILTGRKCSGFLVYFSFISAHMTSLVYLGCPFLVRIPAPRNLKVQEMVLPNHSAEWIALIGWHGFVSEPHATPMLRPTPWHRVLILTRHCLSKISPNLGTSDFDCNNWFYNCVNMCCFCRSRWMHHFSPIKPVAVFISECFSATLTLRGGETPPACHQYWILESV